MCACLAVEEDQVAFLCLTPGIVDSGMQTQVREERNAHSSLQRYICTQIDKRADKENMSAESYNWLSSMHAQGELLRPEQPASSFVRLALKGVPKELNGKVIKWDNARIGAES